MLILRQERDSQWLPIPNEIALILDHQLPPTDLITSALALAFDGQRILMTNLNARGWDIPGGHREMGETPEQTLHREVREETGATLSNVQLLGYQRIRILAAPPPNYRYPHPESYQALYLATVASLPHFLATAESRERALFAPDEAITLRWVRQNREMYNEALKRIAKMTYDTNIHNHHG